MTITEMILSLAIIILAAQSVILQQYYCDKLSEQAVVLDDIINIMEERATDVEQLGRIRSKIFNSSQ